MVANWHISDFHVNDARPASEDDLAGHLSPRGDNGAQVAQFLYDYYPEKFQEVFAAMERRVTGIGKVEAKPTEDGRLIGVGRT